MSESNFTDNELNDFMNELDDFMNNHLVPEDNQDSESLSESQVDNSNSIEDTNDNDSPRVANFETCGCEKAGCEECRLDKFGLNRGWDQIRRDKERASAQKQKSYQDRIDSLFEVFSEKCYGCKAGESDFSPTHDHIPKIMFIDPANRTILEEYEEMFGLNQS